MKKAKYNYRSNLKRLTEKFLPEGTTWDRESETVVTLTDFQPHDRLYRARNGVCDSVRLTETAVRATDLYFTRSDFSSQISKTIDLYVKAATRPTHGFSNDDKILLEVRNSDGSVDRFRFDGDYRWAVDPEKAEEFDAFLYRTENLRRWRPTDEARRLRLIRFYRDELVRAVVRHGRPSKAFTEYLRRKGRTVQKSLVYTHRYSFRPDYIDETETSIEFGWRNSQTYNSLPEVLRVEKVRAVKLVSLADLGVEGAGYHSHGDRAKILPKDRAKVKKFYEKFKSKLSKRPE